MLIRRTALATLALLAIVVESSAQIPEAPGSTGVAPRDEHPSSGGSGLPPTVVPTEPEASAPEIIDLMKRARANAAGTVLPTRPTVSPTPKHQKARRS